MTAMTTFYTPQIEEKTAARIQERFHVPPEYARRLAVAALGGIESHGCDSTDWQTIEETLRVVVASWIEHGTFK